MGFIQNLGMQVGGQIVGTGMGMMTAKWNDERQREQQEYLQKLQMEGQKEMTDYNMQKQLQMWKDTSYGPQVEQMKKAGINPGLLYGMSGGGGQTTGQATGNVSGGTAQQNPGEIQAAQGMGMQLAAMAAQTALTQAQTEKAKAETTKTAGPDTKNIEADTENKILNKVIQEFTGKELKSQFERVDEPNRSQAMKTMSDELGARQGIASTIYEMWTEGKLHEKSTGEIEQILLQNAKTRAEKMEIMSKIDMLEQNIKGGKLDNIIKELETRLQTQTGIDRNSPAWMKIIGRLFVQLLNQ